MTKMSNHAKVAFLQALASKTIIDLAILEDELRFRMDDQDDWNTWRLHEVAKAFEKALLNSTSEDEREEFDRWVRARLDAREFLTGATEGEQTAPAEAAVAGAGAGDAQPACDTATDAAAEEPSASEITFSLRFRDRAHRAAQAVIRKVQNMPLREVRPLLARRPNMIAVEPRLTYSDSGSFESITAVIANPEKVTDRSTLLHIDGDLDEQAGRVLVAMYAAHALTQITRRHGERPYYLTATERLRELVNDGLPFFRLLGEIVEDLRPEEVTEYVLGQLAAEELERREGESNHARMERIAAGGQA